MRCSQKKLEQCRGAGCVVCVLGGVGRGEMSGGMNEYMAAGDGRRGLEPDRLGSWEGREQVREREGRTESSLTDRTGLGLTSVLQRRHQRQHVCGFVDIVFSQYARMPGGAVVLGADPHRVP